MVLVAQFSVQNTKYNTESARTVNTIRSRQNCRGGRAFRVSQTRAKGHKNAPPWRRSH